MVTLQTYCQYADLSDWELLAICRAFGPQGTARAFNVPLRDVSERRARAERAAAEAGPRHTADAASSEIASPRELLERMQAKCTALMGEIERTEDPATQLKLLEQVRSFQSVLSDTVQQWMRTYDGVRALKDPVMELPPEHRDKVLRAWSRVASARLALQ